jgi:hypothetical protein
MVAQPVNSAIEAQDLKRQNPNWRVEKDNSLRKSKNDIVFNNDRLLRIIPQE